MKQAKICTIYLVRHGLSEGNVKEELSGHSDHKLTEKGRIQARERGLEFKDIQFSAVYASDLSRAKETAELISAQHKLTVTLKTALREKSFGKFEGQSIHKDTIKPDLKNALNQYYNTLNDQGRWTFKADPTWESNEEAAARIMTELRTIAKAHTDQTILIVSHGSAIKALLCKLGYITTKDIASMALDNTGYITLTCDGIEFTVANVVGLKNRSGIETRFKS